VTPTAGTSLIDQRPRGTRALKAPPRWSSQYRVRRADRSPSLRTAPHVPPVLGHPWPAPPRPAPRRVRIAEANRLGTPTDLRQLEAELLEDDADETTVVIGSWVYAGPRWANEGETALAVAAAARAREYAQERAQARRARKTTNEGRSEDR